VFSNARANEEEAIDVPFEFRHSSVALPFENLPIPNQLAQEKISTNK
jgi:hypothetical protein